MTPLAHMELNRVLGLCALVGVASHLGYFIRGEHHMQARRLFGLAVVFTIAVPALQLQVFQLNLRHALRNVLLMETSYLGGLFLGMTIYRQFFHPLRHFPGPRLMKLTKVEHMFRSRRLDNYRQLDKLHKEYGDFVRTGPNELTIFRAEALPALLGPRSKCIKSPWYDFAKPNVALVTTRDRPFHDKIRRAWDHAFSSKGDNISLTNACRGMIRG